MAYIISSGGVLFLLILQINHATAQTSATASRPRPTTTAEADPTTTWGNHMPRRGKMLIPPKESDTSSSSTWSTQSSIIWSTLFPTKYLHGETTDQDGSTETVFDDGMFHGGPGMMQDAPGETPSGHDKHTSTISSRWPWKDLTSPSTWPSVSWTSLFLNENTEMSTTNPIVTIEWDFESRIGQGEAGMLQNLRKATTQSPETAQSESTSTKTYSTTTLSTTWSWWSWSTTSWWTYFTNENSDMTTTDAVVNIEWDLDSKIGRRRQKEKSQTPETTQNKFTTSSTIYSTTTLSTTWSWWSWSTTSWWTYFTNENPDMTTTDPGRTIEWDFDSRIGPRRQEETRQTKHVTLDESVPSTYSTLSSTRMWWTSTTDTSTLTPTTSTASDLLTDTTTTPIDREIEISTEEFEASTVETETSTKEEKTSTAETESSITSTEEEETSTVESETHTAEEEKPTEKEETSTKETETSTEEEEISSVEEETSTIETETYTKEEEKSVEEKATSTAKTEAEKMTKPVVTDKTNENENNVPDTAVRGGAKDQNVEAIHQADTTTALANNVTLPAATTSLNLAQLAFPDSAAAYLKPTVLPATVAMVTFSVWVALL